MGVFSNILKQMNAKARLDLYRLDLPNLRTSMVIGIDVVNSGRTSLLGFSATYNTSISQHYTTVIEHEMFKDLVKKEGKEIQEQKLTELRATIVGEHVIKALKQY